MPIPDTIGSRTIRGIRQSKPIRCVYGGGADIDACKGIEAKTEDRSEIFSIVHAAKEILMTYDKLPIYDKCMVHRYRYYVMNEPLISDSIYDAMERKAREEAPEGHPILAVGSSLADSYPDHIKEIALCVD